MFMKRMILVLIAAGSAMFASAQIQFGVKAAYNLSNLTFSPSQPGVSSKSDFSGGVLASIPLLSGCSLQPEIMYSGQGTNFSDSFATGKLNYGYLNVPVLFKFQHSSGLFAETGPQVGFILSAKETAEGQTADIKSSTQSTDFSWVFGIGYKLPLGLGIDARYNLGLTNLDKGIESSVGTVKNSVFQFGLYFMFPKK
jgi:hypothetical protein